MVAAPGNATAPGTASEYGRWSARVSRTLHYFTCIRLLFRTDTDDLTGGVRRGEGALVTSHTCCVK